MSCPKSFVANNNLTNHNYAHDNEIDFRTGDKSSLVGEIYRKYGVRVYSIALRMLGNEADAEDVTQEVILHVIRGLENFRGDSSFSTWLYRITVNAVLVLRRKRAIIKERQYMDTVAESLDDLSKSARSRPFSQPYAEVLGVELRDQLESAIAKLPEIYRDPFILSDIEHLSNSEICNLLGLSLPAVKSRLHRARLALRDALQPYVGDQHMAGAGYVTPAVG